MSCSTRIKAVLKAAQCRVKQEGNALVIIRQHHGYYSSIGRCRAVPDVDDPRFDALEEGAVPEATRSSSKRRRSDVAQAAMSRTAIEECEDGNANDESKHKRKRRRGGVWAL